MNLAIFRSPILDKNGRLFGRWDIFKPLFAVVVMTLLVLTLRVLLQKDTYVVAELWASGGEWWWNNPDPPYWLADPIQTGAVEYDPQGNTLVEVLEVRKFEVGERKRLWMKVRLKVTPSGKSQQYRFRREPLQIGAVIQVSPNNVHVNANVIAIEGVGKIGEPVERIVILRLYGILPWHAEAMKVGSKMVDSNGDVLAEIIDAKVSESQEFVSDDRGVGHVTINPLRADAVIKIKVKGQRFENIDYFAEFQPLKVGFFILFPFDNVNVEGVITEIEPVGE
jgi:hypothetical protein